MQGSDEKMAYKILDTSVIIDGRIADICDTGFIEGILVIPNFVLNELQMIADSADSIKRNRGRRGLDILNKMQKDQSIMVKITDMDFADINEVDAKLVKLAKIMNAKVITNDFNLNKVAEFHGVPVLNINQLSNALKPVVLPGEEMRVALIKEGKDQNQAIGYLDDGTMVVVENGRRRLNDEVEVTVTSVLQTTAGRMIFTRLKETERRPGSAMRLINEVTVVIKKRSFPSFIDELYKRDCDLLELQHIEETGDGNLYTLRVASNNLKRFEEFITIIGSAGEKYKIISVKNVDRGARRRRSHHLSPAGCRSRTSAISTPRSWARPISSMRRSKTRTAARVYRHLAERGPSSRHQGR